MGKGVGFDRKLVLESGEVFPGIGFGAGCEAVCPISFSTAMVGYQELVTDPAMMDSMVVMTYPLIGNYGVTDEDSESNRCTIGGIVVREYNDSPSNFRYTKTLSEFLEECNVPGIEGLDTRAVVKRIQKGGVTKAMIAHMDTPDAAAIEKIREYTNPGDLVSRASCKKKWYCRTPNPVFSIVALDFGVKQSIIRQFSRRGVNVTVVPYDTPTEEMLALKPDGLFISSGPGSPLNLSPQVETVRRMLKELPIFGVGLGHFVLAMAHGIGVTSNDYGYGGGNHPVMSIADKKIEIGNQSHMYKLDELSIAGSGLSATHRDLLNHTVQGLMSADGYVFSTQFLPEGAPGPREGEYLIDRFIQNMTDWREQHA